MDFTIDPNQIPGVILAGGRSSRMGRNKSLAMLGRQSLLSWIKTRIAPQVPVLALNADLGWPETLGMPLVPDTLPGKMGPLAGVLAAMRFSAAHRSMASQVLTVPTDAPFLPKDLVARLAAAIGSAREVAVATSAGQDHPVVALWPVTAADDLERWLVADDRRRVRDFLKRYAVRRVEFATIETPDGPLDPFFNINGPDDLERAGRWLEHACR